MPKIFFQLGHAPELSEAEILAVNQRRGTGLIERQREGEIFLAQIERLEVLEAFCQELGGTVRACEVLWQDRLESHDPSHCMQRIIETADLAQRLAARGDKPVFGISIIGGCDQLGSGKAVNKVLQNSANHIKNCLKEQNISGRFVLPQKKESASLNAAQVEKNRLLEKGDEFVFHVHQSGEVTLGRTLWLQAYESFSQRDYGRPERDPKSGMLPPKLARMLINLARQEDTHTVLDPFCGSGSLLMEAAMMGLHAVGLDQSQKAVQDSQANQRWLQQNANLSGSIRVVHGDARQLRLMFEPLYFDACVTEPYLGPPLKKPLTPERFRTLSSELTELYVRVLGEIRTVVKPGTRVVFLIPRFRLDEQKQPGTLKLLPALRLQGYTVLDPRADFLPAKNRATLVYSRPRQWVQREVFVLQA